MIGTPDGRGCVRNKTPVRHPDGHRWLIPEELSTILKLPIYACVICNKLIDAIHGDPPTAYVLAHPACVPRKLFTGGR